MARRTMGVARIVAGAVVAQLALTYPALVGCGAVTGPETESTADAGDAARDCFVTSTTPLAGGGSCIQYIFPFQGSAAVCGADDSGALAKARCAEICPPNPVVYDPPLTDAVLCRIQPDQLTCQYEESCGLGRRPAGLRACAPAPSRGAASRLLARMAHLEAASVPAFTRLAAELAELGAPPALQSAALRAARDERRHARLVGRLAHRAGGSVPAVRVRSVRSRTPRAFAVENAVEGCVKETFAAAVALVQARTAEDPAARATFASIAADELRHAELAWAVARWCDARLSPSDRARVLAARRRAHVALVAAMSHAPPADVVRQLGVPTAGVARGIALALTDALWAAS